MTLDVVLAGFGGQGILSMGRILASAGMKQGYNVSWLPSYGPEMRGGTANCSVIISDEDVGSPVLNTCDILIAMNGPSLTKFEKAVVPNGVIIVDSSLVSAVPDRKDVKFFGIPATKIADEMGNRTYGGIVLLGKLIAETGVTNVDNFKKGLEYSLPKSKHFMIPEEMDALNRGMNY